MVVFAQKLLFVSVILALVVSCPEFPDTALHYEAGQDDQCLDRDSDGVRSCDGDCDDSQWDVVPGQTKYFEEASNSRGFDYNCDNDEEPEYPDTAECRELGEGCEGDGWDGEAPACGEEAVFISCARTGPRCAEKNDGKKVQRCR